MADSLKGKTGVIVGAGYGVGRAIAIHLARRGARLVIASRSKDELLATQKLISESGGERPLVCTVDVSQPSEVELLQKAAMNHLGRCDFMVSTVFGHIGETVDALAANALRQIHILTVGEFEVHGGGGHGEIRQGRLVA